MTTPLFTHTELCTIKSHINEIEKAFENFNKDHRSLTKHVVRSLLIELRDLQEKSKKTGNRLQFMTDMILCKKVHQNEKDQKKCTKDDKGIHDNYDLIKFCRDAVSHPESSNHNIDNRGNFGSFNIFYGSCGMEINGKFIGGKFDDDVGIAFGDTVIYLKRHIFQSFINSKNILAPYLDLR